MAEAGPSAEDRSRYDTIKKELLAALPKKRAVDKQLVRTQIPHMHPPLIFLQAQIEAQIHNLEATYLNETAQHSGGNIIHGFEGYLKNQTTGRRKYEVNDQDRIFSNSSLTVAKVCPHQDPSLNESNQHATVVRTSGRK
jgi:chromatin modification-related protein EAF6